MLTSDLIRVSVGKRRVRPKYIDTSDSALVELAYTLIQVMEESLHERREDIEDNLSQYQGAHGDYKMVRGLIRLLMNRCEFEVKSKVDPIDLRRAAFTRASELRSQHQFDRAAILEEVSEKYGVPGEKVDDNLYADLKAFQRMTEFKPITPEKLLERYNTSLAQSVLLKATQLVVQVKGAAADYRQLFRYIKFFRLLYEVEVLSRKRGYRITLDGPLSIFQSSSKYGLQMANFLLALLQMPEYKLTAQLRWGKKKKPKEFELRNKDGLETHFQKAGHWMPPEFKTFIDRFSDEDTPWEISENPDIVNLDGDGVFVPDFKFTHSETGQTAYMEIFGYWKRNGVLERLKVLDKHGIDNAILAVSKSLAASPKVSLDFDEPNVYVYVQVLIPREIRSRLEEMED